MPTYQYACTECSHSFEQFQSFSDDALTVCPECSGRLRKVFNAVGVVFKGSGFYRNDSRSTSSSTDPAATPASTPAAASDTSSAKPAASTSSSSSTSSSTSSSNVLLQVLLHVVDLVGLLLRLSPVERPSADRPLRPSVGACSSRGCRRHGAGCAPYATTCCDDGG